MSKFILFTNGILEARYDVAIHGDNIPIEAIAVTDELFFQTINEQDGVWSLVDGKIVKLPFPEPTLDELKAAKRNEIRIQYEADANAPVQALGETWDGGFESAIKLDAARRLSDAAGANTVTFYDVNNVGHEFYLAEALDVVIQVSFAYQTQLAKKQGLFIQIDSAQNKEQLDDIKW